MVCNFVGHVKRNVNEAVHKLAKMAISQSLDQVWMQVLSVILYLLGKRLLLD
jgi:chromosome segregation and condensation protein ScpB